MRNDWRRKALGLPATETITEKAVRAAYWRLVGESVLRQGREIDVAQLRAAKQELLFELGVRVPRTRLGAKIKSP
jgi:hypothetical protein